MLDDDDVLPEILEATLPFCVSRVCVTRVDRLLERNCTTLPFCVSRACVTRVDRLLERNCTTLSFCVSRTCVTRVDCLRRIELLCPSGVTRAVLPE